MDLPTVAFQYTLEAGSTVTIDGLPYQLTADVVVTGGGIAPRYPQASKDKGLPEPYKSMLESFH